MAAALLVYTVFFTASTTAAKTTAIQIVNVTLAQTTNGTAIDYIFAIQIKNAGGSALPIGAGLSSSTVTAITFNGRPVLSGTTGAFDSTAAVTILPSSILSSGNFNPGQSLTVTITGPMSNTFTPPIGSSIVVSATIGSATDSKPALVTG